MQPRMTLLLALVMTVALYWAGLHGPFVLDDTWNFEPLRLWQEGHATLREVIFPRDSLVFSRPVAMASFALTTWMFGDISFGYKIGNLVAHLACGILGWLVLRRTLKHDVRLAPNAELLAALVAAFWLLHPLQVSTVLYSVQRMAQLSTLFALASIWVYLVARQQVIDGRIRPARFNLFLSFPVLLVLGVLSKQNAAVAPAICLVLELAYFSRQPRAGNSLPAFFGIFILLPFLGVAALLLAAPEKLLATYVEWDFTVWDRLLTQPRVLMDYIGMLLIPRGPLMGLYTDDFVVSRGLLAPPATLFAILALTSISIAVIALRKRAPSVFAGWFFFLVAHAVESSFLPLEMYYEHRNYLPSLGLLWGVFGLISLVPAFRTNVMSPRRLAIVGATGFLAILCVATFSRVLVWRDKGTIAQLGVKAHPNSSRARFDVASWSMAKGDYKTAQAAMRHLAESDVPRQRQLGYLSLLTVNCLRGVDEGNFELLKQGVVEKLPQMNTFDSQSLIRLSHATKKMECAGVPRSVMAAHLRQIVEAAVAQTDTASPKWFGRFALGEIYARDGQWHAAQEQIEKAWVGGRDQKIGAFLVTIYIQNGRLDSARNLIVELEDMIKPYDKLGQVALLELKNLLAETSKKASNTPGQAPRVPGVREDRTRE